MQIPRIQSARSRVLLVLIAWCAGVIIASRSTPIDPTLAYSIAGIVIALGIWTQTTTRITGIAMLAAIVLISFAWTIGKSTPRPDRLDAIVRSSTSQQSVPIEIRAMVVSRVSTSHSARTPADPPNKRTVYRSVQMDLIEVRMGDQWVPADGRLRVVLPERGRLDLAAGEIATALGVYRSPGPRRNRGQPDWSVSAIQNGRVGVLYTEHHELISTHLPVGVMSRCIGSFYALRANLRTRAMNALGLEHEPTNMDGDTDAVIGALILGHRDAGFNEMYRSFQRIGIAHLFAISGFHVMIMISMVVMGIRIAGDFPRAESALVLSALITIMVFLPLHPPIVRAVSIVVVLFGAHRLGRRYDRVVLLMLITIGLLVIRPSDLFTLGFQLSIGITALLLMIPQIRNEPFARTKQHGLPRRFIDRLWAGFRTNAMCWFVATPAIMLHAGIISLLAPVAAMLMLPLILLMMIAGYIQVGAGIISPAFARGISPITRALSTNSIELALWIDAIPGSSVRAPNLGIVWTIGATALCAVIALIPSSRRTKRLWAGILVLLVWGMVMGTQTHTGGLRIEMVDVGDGSCYIIESGADSALFDAGSLGHGVDQTLQRVAHQLGARPIRTAFISHDNLDHFNALIDARTTLGLRVVYTTPQLENNPSRAWSFVRDQLIEDGVEIRIIHAGSVVEFDGSTVEVLWPPGDAGALREDSNNASLVLRWTTQTSRGPRVILMTGDIEEETMDTLIHNNPYLAADVLEAPHHGSSNQALKRFIQLTQPTIVLQSTGPSRLDDPELDALRSQTRWFCSARRGGAWAQINDDGTIESGWSVDD